MNILYLSPATSMDYQCDTLAIGLRQLHGPTFVDYPRIPHLYSDYSVDPAALYGRGFTTTRVLGSDADVDRTDIPAKITAKFYDIIVYGSVHRHRGFLSLAIQYYDRNHILFIDGEDQPDTLSALTGCGLYFKRELSAPTPDIHPIHFAIPASKIGTCGPLLKSQVRAHSDPRDRSTYIYKDEHDYYADYHRSLFAVTTKKAGWDTMRTLEILANGCIPLYLDLDRCPATTCTNLPKEELLEALTLMDRPASYWDSDDGHSVWLSLHRRIHLKFVYRSTTIALAKYVLETQQRVVAASEAVTA